MLLVIQVASYIRRELREQSLGQAPSWRNKAKQNCFPAHSPGIHRPYRAYRLLQLALSPEDWKHTLAPPEQSKGRVPMPDSRASTS